MEDRQLAGPPGSGCFGLADQVVPAPAGRGSRCGRQQPAPDGQLRAGAALAAAITDRAVRERFYMAAAHHHLGLALAHLGNDEEARDHLSQAVGLRQQIGCHTGSPGVSGGPRATQTVKTDRLVRRCAADRLTLTRRRDDLPLASRSNPLSPSGRPWRCQLRTTCRDARVISGPGDGSSTSYVPSTRRSIRMTSQTGRQRARICRDQFLTAHDEDRARPDVRPWFRPCHSARQRVRAGRGHEPLGHPVVDVMEPVVEWAVLDLDGCLQ